MEDAGRGKSAGSSPPSRVSCSGVAGFAFERAGFRTWERAVCYVGERGLVCKRGGFRICERAVSYKSERGFECERERFRACERGCRAHAVG
eukprot:3936433-Rhodomonas_salina.1